MKKFAYAVLAIAAGVALPGGAHALVEVGFDSTRPTISAGELRQKIAAAELASHAEDRAARAQLDATRVSRGTTVISGAAVGTGATRAGGNQAALLERAQNGDRDAIMALANQQRAALGYPGAMPGATGGLNAGAVQDALAKTSKGPLGSMLGQAMTQSFSPQNVAVTDGQMEGGVSFPIVSGDAQEAFRLLGQMYNGKKITSVSVNRGGRGGSYNVVQGEPGQKYVDPYTKQETTIQHFDQALSHLDQAPSPSYADRAASPGSNPGNTGGTRAWNQMPNPNGVYGQ